MKTFMAIDQYGQTYHDLGPHPRKALLDRLGYHKADKMYQDTTSGPLHCGYVIGKLWLDVYEVRPLHEA